MDAKERMRVDPLMGFYRERFRGAAILVLVIIALEIWRIVQIAFSGGDALAILGRATIAGLIGVLVSLAIFPSLLHWAIGPFTAVLLRAAKHARAPE